MSDFHRKDATLPSLSPSIIKADESAGHLCLTLVFHPRLERIGDYATLPLPGAGQRVDIGRFQPLLQGRGPETALRGLEEGHVSRQALSLESSEGGVVLYRLPGACRCQVNGRDLDGSVEIGMETLKHGVSVLLGHGVLLWMSLRPDLERGPCAGSGLVGSSVAMCRLRGEIARTAKVDMDVLILGETGVGKELVAEAIHRASARCEAPLVAVNMAAIPESLAPSMLFGSARGAYTGAQRSTRGYFQQARGGSLFMDEIGATPAALQAQLLRALQQRQIQVVGAPPEAVDLRVIAATDARLDDPGGDFSAALRHRLGSIELRVPPLRECLEDLGELLIHSLARCSEENTIANPLAQDPEGDLRVARWAVLLQDLLAYDWPGNVRELGNVARDILLDSGIQPRLPARLIHGRKATAAESPGASGASDSHAGEVPGEAVGRAGATYRRMAEIEEQTLRDTLSANAYEVAAAARALGVSRQALYRRLEDLPDLRLAADIPETELHAAMSRAKGDPLVAASELQVSLTGLRARLRRGAGF